VSVGSYTLLGSSCVYKDYSLLGVLRRIFGPKRDEVTGEWRKLHNEELHDLYPSPNIVWVTKFRRLRWMGHITWNGGGERRA
jgi:hypothetical protein